jgi:site-specific recombinase XerD
VEADVRVRVVRVGDGHRVDGQTDVASMINRFLEHLDVRRFSPATVRAYAFDLANFSGFLADRDLRFDEVRPIHLFDYLDWQRSMTAPRLPAASTMNRRVSTVRSWFGFLVMSEVIDANPVPVPRRSSGLQARHRGLLGHAARKHQSERGGRLVAQPSVLPESLDAGDVAVFLADLNTHRDRAMVLAMLLGGLRSAEVRSLLLRDIDMGMRRVRVIGKGDRERIVPIDAAFFEEAAGYLRSERPAGCSTPECFVVLRGPTTGNAVTEAGMRKVFRVHRERTGASRVRPHRLRHTYATELASAGIDLLVLRELMGHASPETTAKYVHLAPEALAAEFAAARAVIGR